jgi:predicted nucleotidyltransferase
MVTTAEIIEEIVVRLGAAVPPRSRVVLFGSQARGDARAGSDFDVLVIEPEVTDVAAESVRLDARLRGLGVPVDVVVLDAATARQYAAVRGTMVERALREGQLLVES